MDVPREVIYRHAFRVASEYFANRFEEERKAGRVPVLVKEMYDSLYFLPCNERGYPREYMLKSMEISRIDAFLTVGDIDKVPNTVTAQEVTVMIEKPLLTQAYDWEAPVVFMWQGRRMDTNPIPMEKLNVSELMRAAQVAVQKREGLVIDEALKNKIYK